MYSLRWMCTYFLTDFTNDGFLISVVEYSILFERCDESINITNFVILSIIKFRKIIGTIIDDLFSCNTFSIFSIKPFFDKVFIVFTVVFYFIRGVE